MYCEDLTRLIDLLLLIAISYAVLKWRKTIKHMVDEEKQLVLRHYSSPTRPLSRSDSTTVKDLEKASSDSSKTETVEEPNKPSHPTLPPPYASASIVDLEVYRQTGDLKTAARKSLKFSPSYNSMGFRFHRGNQAHSQIDQLILNKPCEIFFQLLLDLTLTMCFVSSADSAVRNHRNYTGSRQSVPESACLDIARSFISEESTIPDNSSGSSGRCSTLVGE